MPPSLEERIAAIEARNAKVEADKAWETSLMRRGGIAAITYLVAFFTISVMGGSAPFFNAFIPVLGYLLSTLTLPFLRKEWQKSQKE